MEKVESEAFEAQVAEARIQIVEAIMERADLACDEVDYLVSSALRHLPPALRAMPAREVIQLFLSRQNPANEVTAEPACGSTNAPQPADPRSLQCGSVFEMLKHFKDGSRQRDSQGSCRVR